MRTLRTVRMSMSQFFPRRRPQACNGHVKMEGLASQRVVEIEQLERLWRQRVRRMESLVTVYSNRGTYVRF